MVIIGVIVTIFAIVALFRLLFQLAAYALPLMIGIGIGRCAFHAGLPWPASLCSGLAAGILVVITGTVLFVFTTPCWARLAIAAPFVLPAAYCAFETASGLIHGFALSLPYRAAIGCLSGGIGGSMAFMRLRGQTSPHGTSRPHA